MNPAHVIITWWELLAGGPVTVTDLAEGLSRKGFVIGRTYAHIQRCIDGGVFSKREGHLIWGSVEAEDFWEGYLANEILSPSRVTERWFEWRLYHDPGLISTGDSRDSFAERMRQRRKERSS